MNKRQRKKAWKKFKATLPKRPPPISGARGKLIVNGQVTAFFDGHYDFRPNKAIEKMLHTVGRFEPADFTPTAQKISFSCVRVSPIRVRTDYLDAKGRVVMTSEPVEFVGRLTDKKDENSSIRPTEDTQL